MYVYPVIIHVYFQQQQKKVVKNPSYVNISWMDLKEGGRAVGFRSPPPTPKIQICRKYGTLSPPTEKISGSAHVQKNMYSFTVK